MVRDSIHNEMTPRLRSERGVSLIHVAIAIFVLTAFSAFVLDQGVMLLARGQAQNVADAAALAGVTTRVKDEPGDTTAFVPAAGGLTEKVIQQSVNQNDIFGDVSANTGREWEWTCPAGITGWCVTVAVYRDGTTGSTTLPVYFANLLGVGSQKTRATASAVAKSANGTRCMKPWLIPDKWVEVTNPANTFDPPGDVYVPFNYSTNTPGSGYTVADIGTTVLLKPGNPSQAISPSDFFEILEAPDYEQSIAQCLITRQIGDTVTVLPGNRVGPTNQGVATLIANGPVDVVIGMFDPAAFEAQRRQSGNFSLTIVNMLSVRVTGSQGNSVFGVITGGVGDDLGPGPTPSGTSSMIRTIQLVR